MRKKLKLKTIKCGDPDDIAEQKIVDNFQLIGAELGRIREAMAGVREGIVGLKKIRTLKPIKRVKTYKPTRKPQHRSHSRSAREHEEVATKAG